MIFLRTTDAHITGRHEYSKVVDNKKVFNMFLGEAVRMRKLYFLHYVFLTMNYSSGSFSVNY